MSLPHSTRSLPVLLCAASLALGLSACGNAVSTASFKGEEHEAAQTVANLVTSATASEPSKICANILSAMIVSRLGGKSGCEEAIKRQLAEIDNLEVTVQSVKIAPGGKTATAAVRSIYGGKTRAGTLTLAKEGGKWKVSALP
jgi:hypothetical protein